MQSEINEYTYSIFEKGYPKKIFYKHLTKPVIYYGPNNSIIGFFPRKVEFWKYVNNSEEENKLLKTI